MGKLLTIERLYSVADLRGILNVSKSKLYELIATGLRPTLYIGISPRWDLDTINKWISSQPTYRIFDENGGNE